MGRRRKSLVDLVRDGTFRASQDEQFLNGRVELPWPELERYRREFRGADDPEVAREVSLELQRVARGPDGAAAIFGDLAVDLRRLGRAGSFAQLERFAPVYFRHFAGPRARQPFTFDPFQRRFLKEFWRRDRLGNRIYSLGLLGIPKGNGKTPLAAVLGSHALVSAPDEMPEVYVISGAKDQASICHTFASNNIEHGRLAAWLNAGATITYPGNLGEFSILSSDGDLAHGTNPSAAIVDEWWQFLHRKQREGFSALKEALHKRGDWSFLLAITTAGWTKDSQLGEYFDAAVAHPLLRPRNNGFLLELADRESGFLMHWYGAPDDDSLSIDDPAVVRAANPAPWINPQHLIRDLKQPGADEYAWRRLHLNQWTKTKGAWLPQGAWRDCEAELEIPDGADIYVGIDAAHSYDTTAVAWAWRAPDGRIVVRSHVWSCRAAAPADEHVAGDELDNEKLVEPFIDELGSRYRIREIVADPNHFSTEIRHLARRYLIAKQHPWSKDQTEAVQEFYRAVLAKRIAHVGAGEGSGRILSLHMAAVGAEKNSSGYWKIEKLNTPNPIDGAMAAIIAHGRARLTDANAQPWAARW